MAKAKRLPGTEDEEQQVLIDSAEKYEVLRDKRLKVLGEEIMAKEVLHQLMKDRKLEKYRHGDLLITIEPGKEKLQVKRIGEPE